MNRDKMIKKIVIRVYIKYLIQIFFLTLILTIISGFFIIRNNLEEIKKDNLQMILVLKMRIKEDMIKSVGWMQMTREVRSIRKGKKYDDKDKEIYRKLIDATMSGSSNIKEAFVLNKRDNILYFNRSNNLQDDELYFQNGYDIEYENQEFKLGKNEMYIDYKIKSNRLGDVYFYAPLYSGEEQIGILGTGYSGSNFFNNFVKEYSGVFDLSGFGMVKSLSTTKDIVYFDFSNSEHLKKHSLEAPFDIMNDIELMLEENYDDVKLTEAFIENTVVSLKIPKKMILTYIKIISCFGMILFIVSAFYLWFFTNERVKKVRYIKKIKVKNRLMEREIEDKKMLFSVVGHDLRSPFTSVYGLVQLLEKNIEKYEEPKRRKMLSMVRSSSEKLIDVTDNLLDWSSIESKKIIVKKENIELLELINKYKSIYNQQLKTKEIEVCLEVEEGKNIWADSKLLETIFRNLLINAIKFTENGGKIFIRHVRNEEIEGLEIEDTGIGMDKKSIEKITCGAGVSTIGTVGETGRGLGLYIAKRFTSLNGGKLTVESEIGKGSKFTVKFPKRIV